MLWSTLLLVTVFALPFSEGVVLCYYESWAAYWPDEGSVVIEDLDPALCTHYTYAFAGIGDDYRIKVNDPWLDLCDDGGLCGYDRFTGMKATNPALLTLLSVGGWTEGSVLFSQMAASLESRTTFIASAVELLQAHNFNGLDFDWEYPTQRGGAPEDRENFVTLLRELKEALQPNGLLLTVAVAAGRDVIDAAYDIPGIASYVDLANVMTYDFHGTWETYTHHQSGLYAYSADAGDAIYMNVDAAISYWIGGGMPSNKVVMGVPLYGRCWTLDSEAEHGYYAPASLPGAAGPWTAEAGLLSFAEICTAQLAQGWTVEVAAGCNEPYTYHMPAGRIWCSYENHDSVIIKGQYAVDHGLAGVMVWAVDNDDVQGSCNGRRFDLTQTLADTFNG